MRNQSFVAVVAASRRELGEALKGASAAGQHGAAYAAADRQGMPVLYTVTGVGKERCHKSMEWLLSTHRPRAVISVGFAGGLDPSLRAGDLVLCHSMRLTATSYPPAAPAVEVEVDERLLNQAKVTLFEAGISWTPGDSLTVPRVVLRGSEKASLASKYVGSVVADMEGYWLGRTCQEKGVPFIALRTVLDTAQEDLPSFVAVIAEAGEGKEGLMAAAYALTGPWRVPAMLRLAERAKLAQRALSASVMAIAKETISERVRTSTP